MDPSWVAKSSTSFGCGKHGNVTAARWQVTLCAPIWHVISRSGVVISITNRYIRFTFLLLHLDRPRFGSSFSSGVILILLSKVYYYTDFLRDQ